MLRLAMVAAEWINDNNVAYQIDSAHCYLYDPELADHVVVLVDVLNERVWNMLYEYIYQQCDAETEFYLPDSYNLSQPIAIRYDPVDRRYLIYPKGFGEVARRKKTLKECLEWARYLALNRHLWDTLVEGE